MTKAPAPGTLKRGRMRGSKITPRKCTTPSASMTSERTKKGSNDGKTISQKIFMPARAAWKASSE